MTAPTSLAETLAAVMVEHPARYQYAEHGVAIFACRCGGWTQPETHAEHVARTLAVAARAWLVARLNEHGPPEVLVGALTNMIEAASQARDDCHDDLRRSWHQGRVSALMDAKRQTESWVAALTEVLTDD